MTAALDTLSLKMIERAQRLLAGWIGGSTQRPAPFSIVLPAHADAMQPWVAYWQRLVTLLIEHQSMPWFTPAGLQRRGSLGERSRLTDYAGLGQRVWDRHLRLERIDQMTEALDNRSHPVQGHLSGYALHRPTDDGGDALAISLLSWRLPWQPSDDAQHRLLVAAPSEDDADAIATLSLLVGAGT